MPNVNIEEKLYGDIREYCKLNKLTVSVFVNDLLRKSFMVEKYNDAPPFFKKKDALEVVKTGQTQEEFREKLVQDFEPVKKEEYVKPEVLSIEVNKDVEVSEREKAKRRVKYL